MWEIGMADKKYNYSKLLYLNGTWISELEWTCGGGLKKPSWGFHT